MKEALNNILAAAKAELEQAQDAKALEDIRVRYLGKKGELTVILKQMGSLSAEERPVIVSWPTRSVPKSNLCWQKPAPSSRKRLWKSA